jgi:hypothetical protein
MKSRLAAFLVACMSVLTVSAQPAPTTDVEASYTRTLEERAEKIVVPLQLTNAADATRVREIIVGQYRALRDIHEKRDQALKKVKEQSQTDAAEREAAAATVQAAAKQKLDERHAEFLKELGKHLAPAQIDQVKDGMTYGVLNITLNAYLKMFPDLKEEQKQQIKDWLIEAREIAMDQGTSREKHAVFGRYKGRINNYLSKAGYDLKKGEENLRQ